MKQAVGFLLEKIVFENVKEPILRLMNNYLK